jgi:hypothetical protein
MGQAFFRAALLLFLSQGSPAVLGRSRGLDYAALWSHNMRPGVPAIQIALRCDVAAVG